MAQPGATPETTDPPKKAPAEKRHWVLLLLTVLFTLVGGALTSVAIGALLVFLPAPIGVLLGMLFGFVLPIFLAVRANLALRRRAMPVILRRLAVLFLVGAAQLAFFGGVLTWSARTTAHLAATAAQALEVVGGVPVLSGILKKHAKAGGVNLPGEVVRPAVGPDGGVLAGPDGGVLASDGGYYLEHPDAGPLMLDAGSHPAPSVDAGAAAPPTPPATALLPAPFPPKPGVGLSPRGPGKVVRTLCAALQTREGDSLLAIATLQGGGAVSWRTVELGAVEKLGPPTLVECAEDGTTAAILGGVHAVMARPGRAGVEVIKALAPGAKLADGELVATRDLAVGPGGTLLAVVELTRAVDGGAETGQALVVIAKGAAAVLRKSGDPVPGADAGDVVHGFSLKRPAGGGTVLVVESWLEGGTDRGVRISGDAYALNPQRLLAVRLDAPKAATELAASDAEPSGIDGVHLQAFGDAALLPDGRALVDANFVEKGPDGWLFVARPGAGIAAVGGELRAGTSPWGTSAPRVQHLAADVSGTVLFRRSDGAVVLFALDKPAQATAGLLGAEALDAAGMARGQVLSVDVPLLAKGAGWVLAGAQLKDARGTRDAVVLASLQDLENGKAEVLLAAGDPLPGASGTPRVVQSIRLGKGRDELLWQR